MFMVQIIYYLNRFHKKTFQMQLFEEQQQTEVSGFDKINSWIYHDRFKLNASKFLHSVFHWKVISYIKGYICGWSLFCK